MPNVYTNEATATVTVTGVDGSTNKIEYAVGGTVLETDFANQLKPVNANVTATVFAGTLNGNVTFPFTAEENVELVADAKTVANVNGTLANLSLYSDFKVNVYVPYAYVPYIDAVTVDGVAVNVADAATYVANGVTYVKLSVDRNALGITDNAEVVITFTEDATTFDVTLSVSILEYAEIILAGDYTAAEQTLMKYIIAYAAAANAYKGVTDTAVTTSAGKYTVEGYTKNYAAISESDSAALGTVFKNSVINLEGSAPVYVFTVADGFTGKVTLNGVEYDTAEERTITVTGIRAYNFLNGVEIAADGVKVTFTYSNYAAWATGAEGASDTLVALVNALYDYCYAADAFADSKNA